MEKEWCPQGEGTRGLRACLKLGGLIEEEMIGGVLILRFVVPSLSKIKLS